MNDLGLNTNIKSRNKLSSTWENAWIRIEPYRKSGLRTIDFRSQPRYFYIGLAISCAKGKIGPEKLRRDYRAASRMTSTSFSTGQEP